MGAAPRTPEWVDALARGTPPAGLERIRKHAGGQAWLDSLAPTVRALAAEWGLSLGDPMRGGVVSLVAGATTPDGKPVVLKVQYPDRECEREADALDAWGGNGAVRLVARDRARWALLIERCVPGTPLYAMEGSDDARIDVVAGLLPRLWVEAPGPFASLRDEAERWAANLPGEWERAGRPWERRLLDTAVAILRELGPDQPGRQVLINQDLHGGNILAARREPWLMIDPKPLVGEREFSLAPLVRSYELGHSRASVLRRLDRLSADLGLDRERARLWTVGQTVACSAGSSHPATHIETVRWLLGEA